MSFPFAFKFTLKKKEKRKTYTGSIREPPMGGAHCLQVYYVRSPGLDPQPFPPNSISRLEALPGGRRHAEIWKVLNNLLVGGGSGKGKVGGGADEGEREGCGGGGSKKWGMGEERKRIQNCSYAALLPRSAPFLLLLLLLLLLLPRAHNSV